MSRLASSRLSSAQRPLTQLHVRPLYICGSQTWPPASTTTLSSMVMSAPDLVFARRPPSSPHVTGLARSALTFLPELLTTCPILPLLMKELHTFRAIVPLAMPVLAQILVEQTTELCQ